MAVITVHSGGAVRRLVSLPGETLHAALARCGVWHSAPCGGKGSCRRCKVTVRGAFVPPTRAEAESLRDDELLAGVRLCCMAVPTGDCAVWLPDDAYDVRKPSFSLSAEESGRDGYACGIDVGTTTLAVSLYARATGKRVGETAQHNRQSVFGDDVISRIHAATEQGAAPLMQKSVAEQLSGMIGTVCEQADVTPSQVKSCTVAANTTMLHLLTGLDPAGIAAAPFTPQSLFGTMYRGEQLGLPLSCDVFLAPCVSAFVGGDITAGMLACSFDATDRTLLLIDVGTNGEMALVKDGEILCVSTAAGPAFEGAHITCGSGGVSGAVCHVDERGVQTIGGAPPSGICGSGILDAVALMLRTDALDESGYLEEDYPLTPDGSVFLTPKDIREIQLAKSAVCSGVIRLMELAEVTADGIDEVFFAGGFGNQLDPASAAAIGLIPPSLAGKCKAVGNAAGKGAMMAALSGEALDRLAAMPLRCRYYELSGDARFNQLFTEQLHF